MCCMLCSTSMCSSFSVRFFKFFLNGLFLFMQTWVSWIGVVMFFRILVLFLFFVFYFCFLFFCFFVFCFFLFFCLLFCFFLCFYVNKTKLKKNEIITLK